MYEIGVGMSVGRIAYHHDTNEEHRRELNNVDPNRIKDNIILIDEIQGRTIDQWISDTMQPHIDAYNAKQKRKDRRIETDYITWHNENGHYTQNAKSKDDIRIAAEFVLSYGNHDNLGGEYYSPDTPEHRKQEIYDEAKYYYSKWISDFQEMYPHLKIGLATMHADEPNGTIHLHGIVIPQATYTRGLPIQCCWSRALEQDGIEKIKDAELAKDAGGFQMARLYKQFREHMKQDLIKIGYQMQREQHGKEHIPSNGYTELMQEATAEMEKAREMMQFASLVEKAKDEAEKIIDEKDHTTIFTTQKDGIFGKPYEVAIQKKEVYDSKRARQNIGDAIEHIDLQADRIEAIAKKTMDMIQSDGRSEAEKEIERLQSTIQEKDKIIKQHEKTIQSLKDYIDNLLSFIQSLNLIQRWQHFWDRVKAERKQHEQEREDRTR